MKDVLRQPQHFGNIVLVAGFLFILSVYELVKKFRLLINIYCYSINIYLYLHSKQINMKTKTETILMVSKFLSLIRRHLVFNYMWEPVADTCGKFYKP